MEEQLSAGGVVVRMREGVVEILLIKDRFGHWTWPKGHIDKGETLEETALREIMEETGLRTLLIGRELGVQEYQFNSNDKQIFKRVHIFLVEALAEEDLVIQRSEIDQGGWFSPEDAFQKIEYSGSREILEEGIRSFREKHNSEL